MIASRPKPLFDPGTKVKVPKEVAEGGRVIIVGREWGPDVNRGKAVTSKQCGIGWVYLCKEDKEWSVNNREAFYIEEAELKEWNQPEKLNGQY